MRKRNIEDLFSSGFLLGLALTLICIIVIALISSCRTPRPKTSMVLVGDDRTEEMHAHPDTAALAPFLSLSTEPNRGASIGFFDVTDVSLTERVSFTLPAETSALANPFTRKRQIDKFEGDIANYLDTASHNTIGRDRSSIYLQMAAALAELSKSAADERTLILFSDLAENESDISFYRPATLALLRSDPERIAAELAAKAPLPDDLAGVSVYFIYAPETPEADAQYQSISAFYKALLEKRGATVSIQANLRK